MKNHVEINRPEFFIENIFLFFFACMGLSSTCNWIFLLMKELLQHIDKQNKNGWKRKYFTEPQISNVYFDLYTAWTMILCLETQGPSPF